MKKKNAVHAIGLLYNLLQIQRMKRIECKISVEIKLKFQIEYRMNSQTI